MLTAKQIQCLSELQAMINAHYIANKIPYDREVFFPQFLGLRDVVVRVQDGQRKIYVGGKEFNTVAEETLEVVVAESTAVERFNILKQFYVSQYGEVADSYVAAHLSLQDKHQEVLDYYEKQIDNLGRWSEERVQAKRKFTPESAEDGALLYKEIFEVNSNAEDYAHFTTDLDECTEGKSEENPRHKQHKWYRDFLRLLQLEDEKRESKDDEDGWCPLEAAHAYAKFLEVVFFTLFDEMTPAERDALKETIKLSYYDARATKRTMHSGIGEECRDLDPSVVCDDATLKTYDPKGNVGKFSRDYFRIIEEKGEVILSTGFSYQEEGGEISGHRTAARIIKRGADYFFIDYNSGDESSNSEKQESKSDIFEYKLKNPFLVGAPVDQYCLQEFIKSLQYRCMCVTATNEQRQALRERVYRFTDTSQDNRRKIFFVQDQVRGNCTTVGTRLVMMHRHGKELGDFCRSVAAVFNEQEVIKGSDQITKLTHSEIFNTRQWTDEYYKKCALFDLAQCIRNEYGKRKRAGLAPQMPEVDTALTSFTTVFNHHKTLLELFDFFESRIVAALRDQQDSRRALTLPAGAGKGVDIAAEICREGATVNVTEIMFVYEGGSYSLQLKKKELQESLETNIKRVGTKRVPGSLNDQYPVDYQKLNRLRAAMLQEGNNVIRVDISEDKKLSQKVATVSPVVAFTEAVPVDKLQDEKAEDKEKSQESPVHPTPAAPAAITPVPVLAAAPASPEQVEVKLPLPSALMKHVSVSEVSWFSKRKLNLKNHRWEVLVGMLIIATIMTLLMLSGAGVITLPFIAVALKTMGTWMAVKNLAAGILISLASTFFLGSFLLKICGELFQFLGHYVIKSVAFVASFLFALCVRAMAETHFSSQEGQSYRNVGRFLAGIILWPVLKVCQLIYYIGEGINRIGECLTGYGQHDNDPSVVPERIILYKSHIKNEIQNLKNKTSDDQSTSKTAQVLFYLNQNVSDEIFREYKIPTLRP